MNRSGDRRRIREGIARAGLLIVSTLLPWAGHAEGVPPTATPGLEVRLAGTVGILTELAGAVEETAAYRSSPIADVDLEEDPSIGFTAEIGYRVHPNFSVSAHVEHLAEISVSVENGARAGGGGQAGDTVLTGSSWTLTADVRGYMRTDWIQPFAVLGAGWIWIDTDDEPVVRTGTGDDPMLQPIPSGIGGRNGFVARGGFGLDVYLSDSFFLTSQATYLVPVGRARDFDHVSVAWGFGYRF